MNKITKKTVLSASIALSLGAANAQAALVTDIFGSFHSWSTDRANFTMLDGLGYTVGGTNDIAMVWDGNAYNASSDYTGPGSASNVTMSSTTQFYARYWVAHDIQMFLPGTYTFDATAGSNIGDLEAGFLNVTVPENHLGMHMLFDWNATVNIDIFVVFSLNSTFGSGIARSSNTSGCDFTGAATVPNCLWDGPGYVGGYSVGGLSPNKPAGSTVWMLSSTDGNGDGVMGIPMPTGGPFQYFNANFNANLVPVVCDFDCPPPVPVPTAVWLFGSGLLGLFGVARRRKDMRHC